MPDSNCTRAIDLTASREYRLTRSYWRLGIVGLVVFGIAQIGSVTVALTNLDGSFKNPIASAIVLGLCFTVPILLSWWLILAYRRHSVMVTVRSIRVANVLRNVEILFDEVTKANWKLSPIGGSVVVRSPTRKIKLDFHNYSHQEKQELVMFIRDSLPDCDERGWEEFEARNRRTTSNAEVKKEIYRLQRFMLVAWGLAIPVMWATLIWHQWNAAQNEIAWITILLFPIMAFLLIGGGTWLASQGDLERTIERVPLTLSPQLRRQRSE